MKELHVIENIDGTFRVRKDEVLSNEYFSVPFVVTFENGIEEDVFVIVYTRDFRHEQFNRFCKRIRTNFMNWYSKQSSFLV